MSSRPLRTPRSDSRLHGLLDVAASLFAQRGYAATSMRDIALGVKMLPGSVYYHFASKEELLVAVYEAGVGELEGAVQAALKPGAEPWERLEAACLAHLQTVLKSSDYAQVLIRVLPEDVPPVAERLRTLRASYEQVFRDLVAALPLPAGTDRHALRLMLLGALNWARFWFDPQGRETPTPPWQEIPTVVKLAMEEDADVIGISSLATDHLIVPRLMDALRAAGLADIQVIVGGIVPAKDEKVLLAAGVAQVFHPGAALDDIVTAVRALAAARHARQGASA